MEKNEIFENNRKNAYRVMRHLTAELWKMVQTGYPKDVDFTIHADSFGVDVWHHIKDDKMPSVWKKFYIYPHMLNDENGWKAIQQLEDDVLEYAAKGEELVAQARAEAETTEQKIERLEAECARLAVENNQLKEAAAL